MTESKSIDILIVDDTPANLRILSSLLQKEGYSVRQAISGTVALNAVAAMLPNLILLDIMMPDMDGYEVCQILKQNPQTADIPIIFLSALDEGINKARAFHVGGADYITKPFYLEEVLARVHNQLALRHAELRNLELQNQLEERVRVRTQQLEAANVELQNEIQERRQLETQLLRMALHDGLTGLPNRRLFLERLQQALDRVHTHVHETFAVLFLDCDRFKLVNDSLGHLVGDELLMAIARCLHNLLEPEDLLARFGGDEFAILVNRSTTLAHITQLADRILEALTTPFHLNRYEVFINASIGIVLGDRHYNAPDHILRDADTAMYRAKASGRGQSKVFDPAMHQSVMQILRLETDLRRAVQQQEFILHYQPIVDLRDNQITGFEALLRWQHPERGIVFPGEFVAIAEETGLITPIGQWVLREACQQASLWNRTRGDRPISISVNLSARQLAQPNFIEQVDLILTETQLDPQHLKLEITESVIIESAQAAADILLQLQKRHICICIDDFGTGYSSLSYLHSLPINTLKIERSFIQSMYSHGDQKEMVSIMIQLAHTMGMDVVAEGVETQEQLNKLRHLNCELVQGYLFSRPVDAGQAGLLIQELHASVSL
ncbi:two-component system response regulator [Leptolyngbya sp. AN02str]